VVERGEPVAWTAPVDGVERRVIVSREDSVVAEATALDRGTLETGMLPPGQYDYRVEGAGGDTLAVGRFDVAEATGEMTPPASTPEARGVGAESGVRDVELGAPLRTEPWPYLLLITLLCGEWIGRRRSGLR
jgi:hypothetical protein